MSAAVLPTSPALRADDSVGFLRFFHPAGPWVLTAIVLDGGTETEAFAPEDAERAREWIGQRRESRNLYFSVNLPVASGVRSKLSKAEIGRVTWLHADIDPRKRPDGCSQTPEEWYGSERRRIEERLAALPCGVPEPTCVVNSGGGVQLFWRLAEALVVVGETKEEREASADDIARYNAWLGAMLDGDSATKDVSRIMRLPGTRNLPNGAKRARGRVPAESRLVSFHADRVYGIEAFRQAAAEASPLRLVTGAEPIEPEECTIDDLSDYGVEDKILHAIQHGAYPDGSGASDASRSGLQFAVSCALVRAGVPDGLHLFVLLNPEWPISASVLDKGRRAEGYARKQVCDSRAKVTGAWDLDPKTQKRLPTLHNFRLACLHFGIRLHHNGFTGKSEVTWGDVGPSVIEDSFYRRFVMETEERLGMRWPRQLLWDWILGDAERDSYHPVLDYLDGLSWDQTPRVDDWLIRYMGASDTPYVRAVGRLWLIAAVRRVRHPGCKFDELVILEGPQGSNKSSALRVLAVKEDWFADRLDVGAGPKETIEQTQGRWILEVGELVGMGKREVGALKAMLAATHDQARMAYDRMPIKVPRGWILCGTHNPGVEGYLRDVTGNRRYWPVETREIDLAALERDRDQLWAEAASLEAQGESIRLERELWADAAREQDARMERSAIDEELSMHLDPWSSAERVIVTTASLWAILPGDLNRQREFPALRKAMHRLGFQPYKPQVRDSDGKTFRPHGWARCASEGEAIGLGAQGGTLVEGSMEGKVFLRLRRDGAWESDF